MIMAVFLIVLFHIIETCLQMLLLLCQTECLPTRDGYGYCKFVEKLYTIKPKLQWLSRYDRTKC